MNNKTKYTIVFLLTVCAVPAALAQFGPPPGPQFDSPVVAADGQVTFKIHAPAAQQVSLRTPGDIPGVDMAAGAVMAQDSEGVWSVALGPIQPGAFRYNYNVDGVAVIDPRNPKTSEVNANTWSLFYISGAEFMDVQPVPHGAVAEVNYFSTALNRFRRMHVYTPPGYESGRGRYPVFYLLHGAMDCDDSWTSVGRAGFILDNLIADGKAKPMIVVMPAGHTSPFRMGDALPAGADLIRDFRQDIVPHIEKYYRVRSGRNSRAIAGLSMGGDQTLNIAIPELEKFAYIGVYSSGIFGFTCTGPNPSEAGGPSWEKDHLKVLDNPRLKRGLRLLWFATGKDDFVLETTRATVAMFRRHNFDVTYNETEGGHTWINWREYLYEFTPRLFR